MHPLCAILAYHSEGCGWGGSGGTLEPALRARGDLASLEVLGGDGFLHRWGFPGRRPP